jgi:hypothetical protein
VKCSLKENDINIKVELLRGNQKKRGRLKEEGDGSEYDSNTLYACIKIK